MNMSEEERRKMSHAEVSAPISEDSDDDDAPGVRKPLRMAYTTDRGGAARLVAYRPG